MNLGTFINEESGKQVNSSKGIEGQCVSVPALFQEKNNAIAIFGATALAIWQYNRGDWDVIPNTPDGVPSPGDIFFFGASYGGGDGHTGLVVNASTDSVTLFEQNDPDGSTAHEKTYSYNDAQGWFHPHFLNNKENEVTDMYTCRRIAYSVWGLDGVYQTANALNGDCDAMFQADPAWLGADTNTCLQTRFDAPEGVAFRAYLAAKEATVATPAPTDPISIPVSVSTPPVPSTQPTGGFFATSHGQEILRAVATAFGVLGTAVATAVTGHSPSTTGAVAATVAGGGGLYNIVNYVKDLLDPTMPNK